MRSRVEQHFSAAAMITGYEHADERALAGERSTDASPAVADTGSRRSRLPVGRR
jgi:hypothetical protein